MLKLYVKSRDVVGVIGNNLKQFTSQKAPIKISVEMSKKKQDIRKRAIKFATYIQKFVLCLYFKCHRIFIK